MTTRFTDGTQGSASQVATALKELSSQGQSTIDQLVVIRENNLLLFNNALSGLNGKRVRANRLQQIGVAAQFLTSDLQDINQPITTASIRCDSNNVSLRERAAPGEAVVSQVRFSASEGTIQALNAPQVGSSGNLGALYRVATQNEAIPVGTFDLKLLSAISTSLVIFDMMDTPSSAVIGVSTSQNGINFTQALSITRNGYRLAAWFQPIEIQFIRITITPVLPDILGGSVFTFGLTDFHAFSVQYHLRSDVYTNQIQMAPRGSQLRFVTPSVPGLTYFLSLGSNPAIEVFPDTVVTIPGTTVTNSTVSLIAPAGSAWLPNHAYTVGQTIIDSNGNLQTVTATVGTGTSAALHPVWSIIGGTTIDNPGGNQITWTERAWAQLNITLPVNIYLPSLTILDHATGLEVRNATGLSKTTVGLTNQYFVVNGTEVDLVIYNNAVDQSRTFDVSFTSGPATVPVSLQVELVTNDLNTTPIFSGAQLLEV